MEKTLQNNVVRVFDDKSKIAEAPIISNEKLESQKKTAISDQINVVIDTDKKIEDRLEFLDEKEVTRREAEQNEKYIADIRLKEAIQKEADAKRKKELEKKNAYFQPKKKNLVDRSAFEGSKNVQTNQRKVNRTRNSNGTISVVLPKLDLRPKGNGNGKRFT